MKLYKIGLIFLAAAMLLSLTGCWNRRELNELSIASALGFDKKGNEFRVTVQLINASEIAASRGSGGERMPVIMQQLAGGKTIFESMRQLTTITPRKIYSSHIRMLVIGEELARDGIAQVLDILSRDHELRTDFYIVVAKNDTAEDVLKVLTPLEKIPSNKLYSSLEAAQNSWGVTSSVDLHVLIFDLISKGKDPALAAISVKGDAEKGQSQENLESVKPPVTQEYQGMAVFRKDKLVGWLNQYESRGYNFIQGNIKSTIVTVGCPEGGKLSMEIIRAKTAVNSSVIDNKPHIHIKVKSEGNVGEVECGIDLKKNETLRMLELAVNREIKRMMERSIAKAKQYKADIFGFGDVVHRSHKHLWKRLEKDWTERFAGIPVHIEVETEIRQTGSVVESFMERMNN